MLSYTCKTAIKAVIYLASKSTRNDKAGMKEIAQHIDASEHTVGKILQTLVRQGLINSVKGLRVGFLSMKNSGSSQSVISLKQSKGNRPLKSVGWA